MQIQLGHNHMVVSCGSGFLLVLQKDKTVILKRLLHTFLQTERGMELRLALHYWTHHKNKTEQGCLHHVLQTMAAQQQQQQQQQQQVQILLTYTQTA